jgi:hypothetical protein
MLDHHIQREIVYRLAHESSMRFSQLKPDDIENKLFDYHLKKTISAGYVVKHEDGSYQLTQAGKRLGKGARQTSSRLIDRAYSLIVLAVYDTSRDQWLMFRRSTHPQLGLWGFLQAQPQAGMSITDTAKELLSGLAIDASPTVHGHGFITVQQDGSLESFIHFSLLRCEVDTIDISSLSEQYQLFGTGSFDSDAMLPNMPLFASLLSSPAGGFAEQTYVR